MSSVKIVFSNVVGGSVIASQVRKLVSQLNNDCELNIGDISVCVDDLDHVKSVGHRSFYDHVNYFELTINGRVIEKPANEPE